MTKKTRIDSLYEAAQKATANWTDADGGDSWEQRDYRRAIADFGNDPQNVMGLIKAYRAAALMLLNRLAGGGTPPSLVVVLNWGALRTAIEKVEAIR